MLLSVLPSEVAAQCALSEALNGEIDAWKNFLASHRYRDGLGTIQRSRDPRVRSVVYRGPHVSSDWLRRMVETHAGVGLRYSGGEMDSVDKILFETWNELHHRLSTQLGRLVAEIPRSGFVLYLSEYLDWCLVLRYALSGSAATLRLMHAIQHPEAVYDIYALIHLADENTRSVMRNVMKSTAKLVAHRGVLIHVDRHTELSVFGPSIDTVYLHEAVAQLLYESPTTSSRGDLRVHSAMEPGCGSGFVSVGLAANLRELQNLVVLDVDLDAIRCTTRNLEALSDTTQAEVHAILGKFDPELFKPKFDLVVVNPPYVPISGIGTEGADLFGSYEQAVGGTELLELLLKESGRLLNPYGAMLMIYSVLAQPEFDKALPTEFTIIPLLEPNGHLVLFDLEDVFEDPRWHEFLLEDRGLKRDAHTGLYRHTVRVVAVARKDEIASPVPNTIAARLAALSTQP